MKTPLLSILIAFLWVSTANVNAQKFGYKGFSGGMMVHTGYVFSGSYSIINTSGDVISRQKMSGSPFGIGGALKIHLSEHFRVGTEGYVSTLNYNHNGSFASIGWGGVLVDWMWQLGKFATYFGVCVGGGSQKNLTISESYGDDYKVEDNTLYRKYGFMAVTPYAGVEFAITEKVRFTFKADYLMNVSNPQSDFLRGVRFFIGFSFYRLKN